MCFFRLLLLSFQNVLFAVHTMHSMNTSNSDPFIHVIVFGCKIYSAFFHFSLNPKCFARVNAITFWAFAHSSILSTSKVVVCCSEIHKIQGNCDFTLQEVHIAILDMELLLSTFSFMYDNIKIVLSIVNGRQLTEISRLSQLKRPNWQNGADLNFCAYNINEGKSF